MPTLVIVAFQYENTPRELQSMIMDVYLVYSFYRDLKFRIFIASDANNICCDTNPTKYLVDGMVDQNYIPFVKNHFLDIRHLVNTRQELVHFFGDIQITDDRRVIVYYTGHGKTGGILLPNNTTLSAIDFRSLIFNLGYFDTSESVIRSGKSSSSYDSLRSGAESSCNLRRCINTFGSQLLIIMDCCNPHGLYLPYKISSKESEINQHNLFINPEIIMLTPCDENLQALAQDSISPFTRELIAILRDPSILVDIHSLIKRLSSDQLIQRDSMAYVSYPHLMVLWSWTFNNIIDCQINEKLDVIVLKQMNNQYK